MRGRPHLPLLVALLALGALIPAPPAAAQATTLSLVALDEGGDTFFFRAPTGGPRNPPLAVAAGSTVRLELENRGTIEHNVHVEAPVDRGTGCCQRPGEEDSVEFQVPRNAPAEIAYYCVLHRDRGMEGRILVAPEGGVPGLEIVRPADQATVPPSFTVEVRVTNFTLGTQGHLHYVVNGTEGLPGWDTNETTLRIDAVGRGYHHVRVELVRPNHTSFVPPIVREAMVFVSDAAPPEIVTPTPTASPTPEEPENGSFLPAPGALAALLTMGAAAWWSRRRAPR